MRRETPSQGFFGYRRRRLVGKEPRGRLGRPAIEAPRSSDVLFPYLIFFFATLCRRSFRPRSLPGSTTVCATTSVPRCMLRIRMLNRKQEFLTILLWKPTDIPSALPVLVFKVRRTFTSARSFSEVLEFLCEDTKILCNPQMDSSFVRFLTGEFFFSGQVSLTDVA